MNTNNVKLIVMTFCTTDTPILTSMLDIRYTHVDFLDVAKVAGRSNKS